MSLNPRITDWSTQRVWVVGASQGIGAEIASQLLAAGARVTLSARNAAALDALAATAPKRAQALPLDATDAAAVAAAASAARRHWRGLDLIMVVAGAYSEMRADTLDLAAARRLLDINLMGPLNVLDAVLPALLKQGSGGIVLVSSVAGYRGLPKALVYGPSKAAVINLAESLYLDLHPRGLGVYLVNPGFVDTPMTAANDFKMPALMTAPDAARATLAGIAAGDFEIHYPRRFTQWLKLLRTLPYPAYFAAVRRFTGL